MKITVLLKMGLLIPLVFWCTTFIAGFIQGDYNHFSRLVSELGAQETNSQYFFTTGLVLCALMSLCFINGLIMVCRTSAMHTFPVILILLYTVSIAGAAIFPLPLQWHRYAGMPSMFLIIAPILSIVFWRNITELPHFRLFTLLSIGVMLLGFSAFFPEVQSNFPGLKQRFFHLGWSGWFVYLSMVFTRLNNMHKLKTSLIS